MVDFSPLYNFEDKEQGTSKQPRPKQEPSESRPGEIKPKSSGQKEASKKQEPSFFSDEKSIEGGIHLGKTTFEDSKKIYLDCISLAESLIQRAEGDQPIDFFSVKEKIIELIDNIMLSGKFFVALSREASSTNHLALSLVNVTILSAVMGIQLGYNKSGLELLGLAAFFHDIGLAKMARLTSLSRKLSQIEIEQIRKHPLIGRDILQNIEGTNNDIIDGCLQHHERLDGSGYPFGLKGAQISEIGQIIGVADMFEALTHMRPFRNQLTYLESFKLIFQTRLERINPIYVDALVKRIGIYPVGSWVTLKNKYVGRVADVNKEFPLRPTILLFFDDKKKKLATPQRVNLQDNIQAKIMDMLSSEELSKLS